MTSPCKITRTIKLWIIICFQLSTSVPRHHTSSRVHSWDSRGLYIDVLRFGSSPRHWVLTWCRDCSLCFMKALFKEYIGALITWSVARDFVVCSAVGGPAALILVQSYHLSSFVRYIGILEYVRVKLYYRSRSRHLNGGCEYIHLLSSVSSLGVRYSSRKLKSLHICSMAQPCRSFLCNSA